MMLKLEFFIFGRTSEFRRMLHCRRGLALHCKKAMNLHKLPSFAPLLIAITAHSVLVIKTPSMGLWQSGRRLLSSLKSFAKRQRVKCLSNPQNDNRCY
jgi:hypothetical protein